MLQKNNQIEDMTEIELEIDKTLGIKKFNKFVSDDLKYTPDYKLSDNLYLNIDELYWHSELEKDRKYHYNLRNDFEAQGLRIFQFRVDEVSNKLDVLTSMISHNLNKTKVKIGARKTLVKKLDSKISRLFLEQNHIKGYKSAKSLGLYYDNELISLMSYKLGKNLKTKQQFIKIERFCSKINYNVIGGFSRLLNQVEKELPNFPIHYWVDLRYGTGDFLLKHGFKLEKETLGWEWTDKVRTYNRLKCRANMDERKLTEKEHAAELGWVKIYDAGQRLYIKK